jgi:hypothetical protein
MLYALEAGRLKLDEYYSQTDNIRGYIYAISTMLAPVNKFKFFLTNDWDQKWRDTYRLSFQEALIPYQEQLSALNQLLDGSQMIARLGSKLDTMLDGSNAQGNIAANEMTRYLDSGTFKLSLLEFLLTSD